jgi:hypothetical protein
MPSRQAAAPRTPGHDAVRGRAAAFVRLLVAAIRALVAAGLEFYVTAEDRRDIMGAGKPLQRQGASTSRSVRSAPSRRRVC